MEVVTPRHSLHRFVLSGLPAHTFVRQSKQWAHAYEIDCTAEEDMLVGKLDCQDMKRLPHDEEQVVLQAMHQTFVDHGLRREVSATCAWTRVGEQSRRGLHMGRGCGISLLCGFPDGA